MAEEVDVGGRYSQPLQENILSVLAYSDKHSVLLSDLVKPELFQSVVYQEIVERILTYVKSYGKAPKLHLSDLMDDILSRQDERAALYGKVLAQIQELSNQLNEQYVLDSIEEFVRGQNLKISAAQAVQALNNNDLDEAEKVFSSALKKHSVSFSPGVVYSRPNDAFSFLAEDDEESFLLGIPILDNYDVGPSRKQLWTFMAGAGRGKSWALIHLGKAALVQGLRVLHVTLELSEKFTARRYAQSLYSMTTKPYPKGVRVTRLGLDRDGLIQAISDKVVQRPSFNDPTAWKHMLKRHKRTLNTDLIIKEFPTNSLRIDSLRAYLESLKLMHGFVPDLLIIDYADLMHKNRENLRLELQGIYEELRGLAVEMNLAIATATQANRQAETARHLTLEHLAEDYGKAAISDKIVAFSQTQQEYALGLARLFVAKCRAERQNFSIVITQNYAIGQFCLQNAEFQSMDYWALVDPPNQQGGLPRAKP